MRDVSVSTESRIKASLGTIGLLLCALGLYGVLGTWVSRRSHEIGLRVSLGATPADVWGLVLRQGVKLSAAGIALGVPLTIVGCGVSVDPP